MKTSSILRTLLNQKQALVVPGVHDAITAKVAEQLGFKAIQVSGFGLAGSLLGLPDMAFLSFKEMLDFTRNIVDAVNIPVMADADTGFGSALNARHVTEKLIKAGCASMNIEDQQFPKRCGHMEGKTIVSKEEMVLKIKACADIRDSLDPDFIINARTDAIAIEGIDATIIRGNAYAEAGADMIFVEAPRSIEQIEKAVKEINALVSINFFDSVEGGKTPLLPYEQMKELGVARISVPVGSIFAEVKGVTNYLEAIRDHIAPDRKDLLISFAEYRDLVGYKNFRNMEKKYLPKFIDNNK